MEIIILPPNAPRFFLMNVYNGPVEAVVNMGQPNWKHYVVVIFVIGASERP